MTPCKVDRWYDITHNNVSKKTVQASERQSRSFQNLGFCLDARQKKKAYHQTAKQ